MIGSRFLVVVLILGLAASMVYGVEYLSDRMNLPPGSSRTHFQVVSNVTGNITVGIPSGFTLASSSPGGTITAVNVTWVDRNNQQVNYTLTSPSTCTENELFQSTLHINGSNFANFPFICVPDIKVTDFKVEYGHGNANYIGLGDELVISNRSATLFNLMRVFNLGYLLTPNENPQNVSILCEYELLPVRTYGHGQVGRHTTGINMSFFWSELRSGYWFRIGVLSQDFTARPPGTSYNVSCANLTYQFAHTRVQAPFTNYSFSVRTEVPFSIELFNDTSDSSKKLFLVQNIESYTAHNLKIAFRQANNTAIFEHPRLPTNQSLVFRLDAAATNISVFFTPPWYIHSTDPLVLAQHAFFFANGSTGSANASANSNPTLINPGNKTAIIGSNFSLQINASDPEGSTITFRTNSTLFNISSTGFISFVPNVSSIGNHSTLINVTDNESRVNSTIFNIEVRNPNPPSDANVTSGGLGAQQGNRSSNFSLINNTANVSGVQLGNNNGTINWSNGVNADGVGDSIASGGVIVGNGFIFFNVSAFNPTFNNTAKITLFNTSCPHDLKPVVSFLSNGTSLGVIQGAGQDCVDIGICSNVSCALNGDGSHNVSFNVAHFTSFAAFGNANLTIDNSGPVSSGSTVFFNASYINRTSGDLIPNSLCNISITDQPSRVDNMTQGALVYIFNRTVSSAGTFVVNVSCSHQNFTAIMAIDNLTVTGGAGSGSSGAAGQGGGAGGPATHGPSPICGETWDCTPWTPCISGQMRRTCHDKFSCGTRFKAPIEVRSCQEKEEVINITFSPTCSDGIKNQGERGIDCGGPCARSCQGEKEPIVDAPSLSSPEIPSCGDGICDADESCSCPLDCGAPPVSCPRNRRTMAFVAFALALLLVVVGLLFRKRGSE